MKALVHHGPGERVREDVAEPEIEEPADAYEVFKNAADTGALKVVLTR